jgi:hypothetical protein
MKMLKSLAAAAATVAALSAVPGLAAAYIKTTTGHVMPKHECDTSGPCVDCTFLDYKTCYDQADRLGLVDKNAGFGAGRRPPVVLGRAEEPLEAECPRRYSADTSSHMLPFNKGTIICPVPGAIAVDAPIKPKRVAEPWLPADNPGGEAAVGIFFAQNCPGYITEDARQLIHTISQMRSREAWLPYNEIKAKIAEATRANRTSVAQELYQGCTAAEPRIAAIEDKLGSGDKVSPVHTRSLGSRQGVTTMKITMFPPTHNTPQELR